MPHRASWCRGRHSRQLRHASPAPIPVAVPHGARAVLAIGEAGIAAGPEVAEVVRAPEARLEDEAAKCSFGGRATRVQHPDEEGYEVAQEVAERWGEHRQGGGLGLTATDEEIDAAETANAASDSAVDG